MKNKKIKHVDIGMFNECLKGISFDFHTYNNDINNIHSYKTCNGYRIQEVIGFNWTECFNDRCICFVSLFFHFIFSFFYCDTL